jgi:hypothetical protein
MRRLITPLGEIILLDMLALAGRDGILIPSYAFLAERAGCCIRTVGNVLARARAVGLLDWQRRMKRVGSRAFQTSNGYWFHPEVVLPEAAPRPVCSKGKHCPQAGSIETLLVVREDRPAALAALVARQAAVEAAQRQAWEARHTRR